MQKDDNVRSRERALELVSVAGQCVTRIASEEERVSRVGEDGFRVGAYERNATTTDKENGS